MALKPRFQPGSVRRPFVDREPLLAEFDASISATTGQPQVLVVTGIGGIGKSRLLTELRERVAEGYPTALLDLQVPSLRQPENALAVLRGQFGQRRIRFYRFDLAYAVLWQRLHPHLAISGDRLGLVKQSEILTEIINDASGVPVFGTAARLIDSAARRYRRWQWMRRDETLQVLDRLSLPELTDAVSYLFAEDLRAAIAEAERYVVFVDAYEALAGGAQRGGSVAASDAWLRDLVGQLDQGLVVVASREPLGWQRHDPEWERRLRTLRVDDLPMPARHELLAAAGITDPLEQSAIASSSAGVPFYLHLAIDARARSEDNPLLATVEQEQLLERFLHHVGPDEVRMLELLSVPRLFDSEIFTAIAEEFALPGNRLAWESITSYSFVQSAGTNSDRVRLHQLMVGALRNRLTGAVIADLHRLQRALWDGRAADPGERLVALREAAYHGLRSGELSAADLLDYTARIASFGGKQGIDGVLSDLAEYLSEQPDSADPEITNLSWYLQVERALLLGDPERAGELTRIVPADLTGPIAGPLAVAAAHARRMLGSTDEALRIYRDVWARGSGSARLQAGLWVADLDMAQGRFAEAVELSRRLLDDCPPEDHAFRGDVARLLNLTYRFAFDLDAAAEQLAIAEEHYRAVGSEVSLANLATNRAELLAFADPAAAIPAAGAAIEANRELGAQHEQGKAYTALGIAALMLGDLDRAEHAFTSAAGILDAVGYRSGRARAELFMAVLLARRGRGPDAVTSAAWAVAELVAAEVYPTLIVTAERLLELIGRPDAEVSAAAAVARTQLQALPGSERAAAALDTVIGRLLGFEPGELYRTASAGSAAAGFYNHNLRGETPYGPVIVRIPVSEADVMDLRIWPEPELLRAIAPHVAAAPRLRWSSAAPPFQLHEFVDGEVLHDLAPRGTAVPDFVIPDVVALFAALDAVPVAGLPPVPAGWPADGDTVAFAARLTEITRTVYRTNRGPFGRLFRDLGIPEDPVDGVAAALAGLSSRPFRLVHTDVHRKNMIVRAGSVVFIDWELALLGDPVYDLAVHLHKMAYLPEEQSRLLARWAPAVPSGATEAWSADLQRYLRHERVKSAVVDSIRYAKLVRSGQLAPAARQHLQASLVGKLRAARELWGLPTEIDPASVGAALDGAGTPG